MKILLLDLDAVNPGHLGCYGYRRNTSPHIDRIANEGVRFNQYYTTDAPCAPSRTALMTGKYGIHNGLVGHGGTAGDLRLQGESRQFRDQMTDGNLPGFLQKAGLRTALVSSFAQRHSVWGFYAGFNEMINSGMEGKEIGEDVTPDVLAWLERNRHVDDWFLYVNYWDAHTPYRTPEEYGNPFAEEPLPDWPTEDVVAAHQHNVGPHGAREINMYDNEEDPRYPRHPGEITDMAGLRKMIDGYDCGIRYMDNELGKVFAALERMNLMDELIIIITSDHGENMGELGLYGEHATADYATCRIPMIIRWPEQAQGVVDEALHSHIDLLPTLADMLGLDSPPGWDGQSYADTIRSGAASGRPYVVSSQCAHVCQRSVRFDRWLYIRTYHDGYNLFPDEMLFDVEADPHEQTDLAGSHRSICMEAVYYLNEWHDQMMRTMPPGCDADPLWTVMAEGGPYHAKGQLARYVEWLHKTGRGAAADELYRRHPNERRWSGRGD